MNKYKSIGCALALVVLTACTTTNPQTGAKVPDKAKTEEVKAVAQGVVTFAITESLSQFPKDADTIALYARAAGGVFCDMKATKQFSPETLEASLFALALPEIKDAETRKYITTARNAVVAAYKIAYAKRFNAELNVDEWPYAVADIFCAAIDQGLKDSGRTGIK